jgi:transposase-like protein
MNKKALFSIRDQLRDLLVQLNTILDDEKGCPHTNRQDVTTMSKDNMKKFFCFDCGRSFVQEIEYDEL